jgi:hypothetical protein
MTYALADRLAPRQPEPAVIRTLWRMQGPARIVAAELRRHPAGRELVVFFEGVADDILETRFERLDFAVLERRAEALKDLLAGKGWVPLRPGNQREGRAGLRTPASTEVTSSRK